jgi:predicted nucleic acid-binding protein
LSGFLLDTNVISSLSPARMEASGLFLEWLDRVDGQGRIFLSVVSIHEIEKGITLLEHKGDTLKAPTLKRWLGDLVVKYHDKIIPVDAYAAVLAGQLEGKAISAGHDPGMADATMGGIALAHNLVIVTHNAKRFMPFGIPFATADEAVHLA